MAKNSKIEWCHHTVNFWWGCTFARLRSGRVRQECVHCYAKTMATLFSRGKATWGAEGRRWLRTEAAGKELHQLAQSAFERDVRERVFVNSMSDAFEDRPDLVAPRTAMFERFMEAAHALDILLLTKRPENVCRMVPASWLKSWPSWIWIGTTAGTQAAADEAVPELLKIPARVRFLSCEPLLESIRLDRVAADECGEIDALRGASFCDGRNEPAEIESIHWVIAGGESGPGARPMHPDWTRSLRDQCQAAGVPFFFKQWGGNTAKKKKAAGRVLDGREWDEVPR